MINRKNLYGYHIENGELAIVPQEAETVQRITTLYIAGGSYQREFSIARELVGKAGYTPVDSTFLPLGLKENDYMRISIAVLEAADTVVALKGWTHSQGAQIEWAYAQRTGKQRMTLAQFCEANNVLAAPEDMEVGKHEKAG